MTDPGTALIVGVGDGLGAALCRRFAAAGHAVAMAARRADKLAPLAAAIEGAGGRARAYAADATEDGAVARLFARAEAELGGVEVAVYNVGARLQMSILDMESRAFEQVWRNACLGAMIVGREAAQTMVARGGGSILFTGGRPSRRAEAGLAAFAVGKFGLRALAESMARELGPKGIHVAHFLIEGGIDNARTRRMNPDLVTDDGLISTDALAEIYVQTHRQPRSCWSFEADLRPWRETF